MNWRDSCCCTSECDGRGGFPAIRVVFMDIRPYLDLIGARKKKEKKKIHLKRGIPYTPQEFPPEERPR